MQAALFLGLMTFATVAAAARQPVPAKPAKPPTGMVLIRYPDAASALVKANNGTRYRVTLAAEPNARGTVSDLVLVVREDGAAPGAPNLLDRSGWYGYQPYMFSATDFKSGVEKSLHGARRSLCRNGLKLDIMVKDAVVEKIVLEHRFVAMTLEVALEDVPLADGLPACR